MSTFNSFRLKDRYCFRTQVQYTGQVDVLSFGNYISSNCNDLQLRKKS